MNQYHVLFGAYFRDAECTIEAEDNEAARRQAIEEFNARSAELQW